MKTCFLTSSPCREVDSVWKVDPVNGLEDNLLLALKNPCKALFVASSPDDVYMTEKHAYEMKEIYEHSGIIFEEYILLDRRNQEQATELVSKAEFIVLAGGHVPTQLDFFYELNLRQLLTDFDGIVMGISAGTMNSADIVYVHPEREGETAFTDDQRYRQGLGLCKAMVLPHYQIIKNDVLDGMRLFEDVAYSDSAKSGYDFYCLPDGSYIYVHDGIEELRGEGYQIHHGELKQVTCEGERLLL